MNILTINTGSSSVRLALFTPDGDDVKSLAHVTLDAGQNPIEGLTQFIATIDDADLSVVAHRVVHGGSNLTASCWVDDAVEREIERLTILAPLHNGRALAWIRAARDVLGHELPHVAVFDTTFFCSLPRWASSYAIPPQLRETYGVRRYGFHGIAHQAMCRRLFRLRPDLSASGRVISLQLGSGCSATATRGGRAIDTSMGFSPLEGLVMATRSGDIDPAVIAYLAHQQELDADQVLDQLNSESGLKGLCGTSRLDEVVAAQEDADARDALDLYCYRARKYVGAYIAALGGVDAILFGGGAGENAPLVRARILGEMTWAGIALDADRNDTLRGVEGCISTPSSRVEVRVVLVDEGMEIALEATRVIDAEE